MTTEEPDMTRVVTRMVSRIILQSSGRSIVPDPATPLFEGRLLRPEDLAHLLLALHDELGVEVDPAEATPRHFSSINAIVELAARRGR